MAGQDKRTSLINIDETQEGGAQPRRKRCAPGNDNEPYFIKSVPLSPTFRSTYPSFLLFLLRHIPRIKIKIGRKMEDKFERKQSERLFS